MLTARPSAKAYHVSNNKYSIATVDHGVNATVKIWTARRHPSRPHGRVSGDFWQAAVQR